MDKITDDQIAEMEKVAAAATPGPWKVDDKSDGRKSGWTNSLNDARLSYQGVASFGTMWGLGLDVAACPTDSVCSMPGADAAHIATFDPATVLALLSDLRASREQVERMRGVVEAAREWAAFQRECPGPYSTAKGSTVLYEAVRAYEGNEGPDVPATTIGEMAEKRREFLFAADPECSYGNLPGIDPGEG